MQPGLDEMEAREIIYQIIKGKYNKIFKYLKNFIIIITKKNNFQNKKIN
jgi:hypothetical protein